MVEKYENLAIAVNTFEPFVLCLALGVIETIKSEVWSSEAGIWTIRRPAFFDKLAEMNIPREVIKELDIFNELSALENLSGKEAVKFELERIEKIIKKRLENFSKTFWYGKWLKENE